MVKKILLVISLLFCQHMRAQEQLVPLTLSPLVCVSQDGEKCAAQLTISWHYHEPLCLYLSSQPKKPVLCQARGELISIMLELSDNLQVQLRHPTSLQLMAEREVKMLKVAVQPENLHKRRLHWGIF